MNPPSDRASSNAEPAHGHGRRRFLVGLAATLSGATAMLVAVPGAWLALASAFRKPGRVWRFVGRLEGFPVGTTTRVTFRTAHAQRSSGVIADTAAWLRRTSEHEVVAFAVNCTHLGCPVRWMEGARLFMCPCHGGVYYENGSVAAGPPPQPLVRYPVRVRRGRVEVQTRPLPIF